MKKAIIFDFDGVIQDTFRISYEVSKKIIGEALTEESFRDIFSGNVFQDARLTREVGQKISELYNKELEFLTLDKEVKKNLEKLAKQYPLFIISSNQEKTLNTYFQNNNCTHIFQEILGAETHQSKVAKFRHLFEKYQLKAEDCVFVTDTLGDILEAKEVGVKVIAVDFGFHKRDRLEKGEPFKIVSSFEEILEIIAAS